jgi:hypothetical protein
LTGILFCERSGKEIITMAASSTSGLRSRNSDGSQWEPILHKKQDLSTGNSSGGKKEATIWKKLFTHHDSLHIHKVLGLACLVSYVYRYSRVGERDAGFGPNVGTLVFVALHLSLNVSSFIFEIPERRINSGYRIWPEYRIHSLVFAARSLACMTLFWWEQTNSITEPYYGANILIVFATLLAADYGSYLQRDKRSPTIRGIQFFSPAAKFFFSVLQFEATAMCLVGPRRYTIHLAMITIIQLNAFLMTLRRKNIGNQSILVSIYGFLLAAGLLLGVYDDFHVGMNLVVGTIGNVAAMLRMGPLGLNKYILWMSLGFWIYYVRTFEVFELANNFGWTIAFGCSLIGMVVLGLWRRHHRLDC